MNTRNYHGTLFAALTCMLGASACNPPLTGPEPLLEPENAACGPQAKLDDGEDNNNQTLAVEGRGGYWYTYADEVGTTITPTAGAKGGTFQPTAGGAKGSAYAMRMSGTVGQGAIVFAGMGMNLVDPKGPYDASKYKGVTFWAKKTPGTTPNVRVKFPDKNTDPDGGVCSACYNDHGRDLKLSEEWTQYFLPFSSLSQERGWGAPKTSSIDTTAVYAIQFQVKEPGAAYDVWIDDLAFTGCGS